MKTQSNPRIAMAGAAALVILSAFMPWVSLLGYSRSGIDYGDGTITLIVGIVGLLALWKRVLGWVSQFIAALVIVAVGFYDLRQAGSLAAIGLYLTFAAGVVWGCAAGYERKATAAVATTPPAQPDVTDGADAVVAHADETPVADERPPALPLR